MVDYSPTVWSTGDLITAALMNHGETQYATAKTECTAGNWAIPASAIGAGTFAASRFPTATRTLYLSAAGGLPRITSGCASQLQQEIGGALSNVVTLDFDHIADEHAQWYIIMPDGYNGTTMTAQFIWTKSTGAGNVKWGIKLKYLGDGDNPSMGWGTAIYVVDAAQDDYDIHISPVSAAITPGGSPNNPGLFLFVDVIRLASDVANDTLAQDAKLIGIKLEYAQAYTDG